MIARVRRGPNARNACFREVSCEADFPGHGHSTADANFDYGGVTPEVRGCSGKR